MDPPPLPRTLILDYYDSYTNNLLTLFTSLYTDRQVLEKVVVVKADHYTWDVFQKEVLPNVDCIILSPGPGRSDNPSDIGFALDLLRLHRVPVLGVCLGHQAIATAFGGQIINTPKITHGHVIPIQTLPFGLFASPIWTAQVKQGESVDVVVYNSLTVDPQSLPDCLEVTAWSGVDGGTIQGLRHHEWPIWGVQYHPESISSTEGSALLHAFLDQVHQYHSRPETYPTLSSNLVSSCSYRTSTSTRPSTPLSISPPNITSSQALTPGSSTSSHSSSSATSSPKSTAKGHGGRTRKLKMVETRFEGVDPGWTTDRVIERFIRKGKGKERVDDGGMGEIWLDGETLTRPSTSSLSIPKIIITYNLHRRLINLYHPSLSRPAEIHLPPNQTFWEWFDRAQREVESSVDRTGNAGGGFKGGWVGWFGYEMKEESLEGYRRRGRDEKGVNGDGKGEPNGNDGRIREDGEDEGERGRRVDACWSWCDWIVEKTVQGEWVLRGVQGDGPVADTNGDVVPGGGTKTRCHGYSIGNGEPNGTSHDVYDLSQPTNGHTVRQDERSSSPTTKSLSTWLSELSISLTISLSRYTHLSESLRNLLQSHPGSSPIPSKSIPTFKPISDPSAYISSIQDCRDAIHAGESYELTLTTAFTAPITPPTLTCTDTATSSCTDTLSTTPTDPFQLYLTLRKNNPAYYSTYINPPLLNLSILSSSPERFLKIENGRVEMMPIKGTKKRVKEGECVCVEGRGCGGLDVGSRLCTEEGRKVDWERGEELRGDLKERAENLMIVDLIRSDLLSCCVPSTVTVPKLIALESYAVHHLVTTVVGQLSPDVGCVEALKRCFPPGSMTGAPKLRSVQLLETFEDQRSRGVYSGALGYISVDGNVDLSVVIRTIVIQGDEMSIGAGGAITWLSDAEKEWEEVLVKVASVVGVVGLEHAEGDMASLAEPK